MLYGRLIISFVCFLQLSFAIDIRTASRSTRDSRKLFGGYRITPRFCKPTRKASEDLHGPYICMFNHECGQRNGQVVGACMDGFLFGACCQLPTDSSTGELIESDLHPVTNLDNDLSYSVTPTTERSSSSSTLATVNIISNGVSQIAQSLLSPGILPTAQDNAMVQIDERPQFSTSSITHSGPDTQILDQVDKINQNELQTTMEDRRTTVKIEYSTVPYSEITISNAGYQRPSFRPKPSKPSDGDKYVLVPTITVASKLNKTHETNQQPIVNIYQLLNDTTTTSKRPVSSTSYLSGISSTRRPVDETKPTSREPPSTSYVFSTTLKPRRTTTSLTTTKRKSKPTKNSIRKPTTTTTITDKPSYFTLRPGHSTVANSPSAFSTKPPSTSYVYSAIPTRRPPSTLDTHIAGPGFSVTSPTYSTYSSPAPTLIVLGPIDEQQQQQEEQQTTNYPYYQSTPRPPYPIRPNSSPSRKPINSVTINNHVTQNIYSTSERPPFPPQPTVLITPKPSISSSIIPNIEYNTAAVEVETSGDELINFPPVRNPNLNMSHSTLNDDDITTPAFVEDEALNVKVESFVNKIIQGLQEPFQGLRDVVYNGTKTTTLAASITTTTTKRPVRRPGTTITTRRPPTTRITTRPTTTRRTTTRRTIAPATTTRRTVITTTTKRTRTTRRPTTTTTTTESYIEHDDNDTFNADQYRNECGIRPLLKTGRIVGGKPAKYGEFPWQVLVKESTWLGLFTKNKCGGVLISNKFVMTAAHCQPGFLASLIAVFGELDINGDLESRRPVSRNVKRVIVHRKYDAATFENDLALLELETPIQFDAHIIPICLPRDGADFTGRMATVTGWGRLKYGGGVPSVLQEVQVPIMENHVCQEMFRTASHSKVILDSFLCAGYANGQKDSCEGDSGGPLVLQRPDGRYELAGTVSHGIKCAAPYLPGVYMRTTYYKKWIQAITGIVD